MKLVIGDIKLDHKKHLPKYLVKHPIRTLIISSVSLLVIGGACLAWYIMVPLSGKAIEDRYLYEASTSESCIYCGGNKTYSGVISNHTYKLIWNKYFNRRFHISIPHRYRVCEKCKVVWVSRLTKAEQDNWDKTHAHE